MKRLDVMMLIVLLTGLLLGCASRAEDIEHLEERVAHLEIGSNR
jgi:hypothetical protein